jgi:hypothetical protein
MLVVLPDETPEAEAVIDRLVTKIQGKNSHDKGMLSSEEAKVSVMIGKASKHGEPEGGFGKLKTHTSQFARSDTELSEGATELEDSDSDSSGNCDHREEWDEMKKRDWIHLPFELQCADSILFCVNELLAEDTAELEDASTKYINTILHQKHLNEDHFKLIRLMKDGRRELASRVNGFCSSMTRMLNEGTSLMAFTLCSRLLFLSLMHGYLPRRFDRRGPRSNESFAAFDASGKFHTTSFAAGFRKRVGRTGADLRVASTSRLFADQHSRPDSRSNRKCVRLLGPAAGFNTEQNPASQHAPHDGFAVLDCCLCGRVLSGYEHWNPRRRKHTLLRPCCRWNDDRRNSARAYHRGWIDTNWNDSEDASVWF